MQLKLGKLPARDDPRDFKLKTYLGRLPPRPKEFGHEGLVSYWGMLANDIAGDCAWAAAAHSQMIWGAEGGNQPTFDDQCVLSDYSDGTGYDPARPETDCGTYYSDLLSYWQHTGILDSNHIRHKAGPYMRLDRGDTEDLLNAIYLFGAVPAGIMVTDLMMKQFNRGLPWTKPCRFSKQKELGGHAIPFVTFRKRLYCVTWGKLQPATLDFYRYYSDEAYAVLSPAMFKDGVTLEGFNIDQLRADLAQIRRG